MDSLNFYGSAIALATRVTSLLAVAALPAYMVRVASIYTWQLIIAYESIAPSQDWESLTVHG